MANGDDFRGGKSPWGSPPGGGNGSGRGPTPPDIDEIIRNIQKYKSRKARLEGNFLYDSKVCQERKPLNVS